MNEDVIIPDDQQEDENDISQKISFKDAVVLNSDWTIETIHLQINKGNINLQPGFQRRVAWDDTRKSRLIESIIVGMPVPNIVLAENRDHRGRFLVIDGKQRLVAISDFFSGLYKLKGLDIRPDLNDCKFADLPPGDKEYFENATLRSTLIKNWSDENFLYAIFYRLNSGSLPLSPQELRKALIGSNLLGSIENYLVNSGPFKQIFGDKLDKRMRDSELILRFIAFEKNLTQYKGDFKEFLDLTTKYFEDDWQNRQTELALITDKLDASFDAAFRVFAQDAYKKWLGDKYERVINRAIFDCISRFFSDPVVLAALPGKEADVSTAYKQICINRDFKESIEKTTKSIQATRYRIDSWGQSLASCLGLNYDKHTQRIV